MGPVVRKDVKARLSFFPFPKLTGPLFSLLAMDAKNDYRIGDEANKFLVWWKGDPQRALCTLEQAIGAYVSTFPGRLHFLLVELLEPLR